ncbi:DUF2786 domain-containing protein [Glycomyces sp. NPDC049804]|uniref:DUF2786 domain-containing protein n=1 Tax=Glycomyces sp. NPDC049804 TaxID=3154363 RepID=UPI003447921F
MSSCSPESRHLERVRQLLAIAEDPATSPEAAEVHTAKAMELLAKYGIDAALLHDSGERPDHVEGRRIDLPGPYALEKVFLYNAVARPLRCKLIEITTRDDHGKRRIHIFGYTADLDRAHMLYTSLLHQQAIALIAAPGPVGGESKAAFKRSFCHAFASTVRERLTAIERRARAANSSTDGGRSTDLVLVDRNRAVAAEFKSAYPRTHSSGRRRLSGTGRDAGRAAGQRADLGGSRIATGRRAIGS